MVKVSIICTNYNKGGWIADAIESFLRQKTSFSYEIILVDDASTDESPAIIKSYADNYPEKIRAFFQTENLGITKTWVSICQEAKGEYIARCDGDDYWIDDYKLQKQVELLEQSQDSKWSNSDFDFVNSQGKVTQPKAFANQSIPLITTYEEMLALKGMTMASTWLVERELMLEVNQLIALDAVDDTFNLQLELFRRTKLSFLSDATTVYRIHDESDSRTKDMTKLRQRFQRLLETQIEYVNKYPDTDYKKAFLTLLGKHTEFETLLSQGFQPAAITSGQKVTVYYASDSSDFSEDNVSEFPLQESDRLVIKLPAATQHLRIDLSEVPSYYKTVRLIDPEFNTELLPVLTNGLQIGEAFFFNDPDPQIVYNTERISSSDLIFQYEMFNLEDSRSENYLIRLLSEDLYDSRSELQKLRLSQTDYQRVKKERNAYKKELEEMVIRYNAVTHSRRWTIPTALINMFRRKK
ncbi:glycosyltransferase family 2 protein [Streptococcus pantholopis]|uniref:Glycosyl transferase n=1 Tax=Streptococcus pantholopis TaxID=1811193 RepID=A0A172Q6T1_9STRE|nr:glycosyltransferase [Streptococcus pantholopis]AND79151.1 glycosyl transferase [Streptococcus pantholopis]